MTTPIKKSVRTIKKIIALIACFIFAFNVMAQDTGSMKQKEHSEKYCAKVKDGNLMVMQNKAELTIDVTLENGTIVKTDGTVIKKDGSKMVLKDGECLDHNGNLLNA